MLTSMVYSHLWKSVTNEVRCPFLYLCLPPVTRLIYEQLQDAGDILPEEETPSTSAEPRKQLSEELNSSFIFGGVDSRQSLTQLHPNAIQIFQLWNTFIEGVNPLTKIVHVPTLQQELLNAASDLSSLSPEMEALMFSIYSSALLCMQVDEVQKYFKEPKSILLTKYRQCAQQALVNAGILATSDLRVLQAFLLFIVRIRLKIFLQFQVLICLAFSPNGLRSTYLMVLDGNLRPNCTADWASQRWFATGLVCFRNRDASTTMVEFNCRRRYYRPHGWLRITYATSSGYSTPRQL